MSYDIEIVSAGCEHCGRKGEVALHVSLTYNYADAIYLAFSEAAPEVVFPENTRGSKWTAWINEKKCSEVSGVLRRLSSFLKDPKNHYRLTALMPTNGWGSLSVLQDVFGKLAYAAECNQDGVCYGS